MKFVTRASALAVAACMAAPAQADFSLSPRFFLYFDNASQRQSGFDELASLTQQADVEASQDLTDFFGTPITVTTDDVVSASINNQMVYPLFGGAFTMGLDSENRTQVSFSALYGTAKSEFRTLQTFQQTVSVDDLELEAEDVLTQSMVGTNKTKRLDVELSVQHRLNERFALLGGLRYEHLRSKGEFDFTSSSSNNALNLFELLFDDGDVSLGVNDAEGTMRVKVNDNIYSARIGGAAFAPINQRNLVYVNGLVHVTHQTGTTGTSRLTVPDVDLDETNSLKIKAETTLGPDIAVGYVHRFTDTVGLDVRYRAIVYFPVSGNRDFDDPRVNHGLNAGLTFNF